MYRKPVKRLSRRLFAPVGVLLLMLSCGIAVAEGDFYPPFNIHAAGHLGACFRVLWDAEPTGVTSFSVERKEPFQRWEVPAYQQEIWACGMEPGGWYDFEVCTWYGTEDGDIECEEARLQLMRTGSPDPAERPPRPQIVETHYGETFIGVKWDAFGFDYDSYFVNYNLKGEGPTTIHHDDDGTWGYQRIDGLLPSRTYVLGVQGCTETFFGIGPDNCWDWSLGVEVTTASYPLHSGPDTCAPGFVWREAFADDHVCVSPQRRDAVTADNAKDSGRGEICAVNEVQANEGLPWCSFGGPRYCRQGFVWREARPEDAVCVTPAERDVVRQENATANQRYARPR